MKQSLAPLALFVLCACPSEGPKPPPPSRAPAAAPASQPAGAPSSQPAAAPMPTAAPTGGIDGKGLYLKGCANCHGLDGTGAAMRRMMPNIGNLTSAEMHQRMSDEAIFTQISEGKGKMPPFKNTFKPEEIKAIVAFVRTLKR